MKTTEITTSLLTIMFIGLKLTNYIDWPWWKVLSPLWVYLTAKLILFVLYLFLTRKQRKRKQQDQAYFEQWKKDNNSESRFQYRMHKMIEKENEKKTNKN